MRRVLVAVGSALGAALAAVVVSDLYGLVRDRFTGPAPIVAPTSDPEEIAVIREEGDPLTALVQVADACPGFVVPADLELPDPVPVGLDPVWVYENGGADASGTPYRVTVQGTSDTAVVLQGLDVVDVRPLDAADELVHTGSPCLAASLPVRRVGVDLDTVSVDLDVELGEPVEFPLQVSSAQAEVFNVAATTDTCFCTWAVELRWVSGGEAGTTRLEPPAGRFVTAPIPEPEVPLPEPTLIWTPPPIRATIPPELLLPDRLILDRVRPELLTPGAE